MSVLYFLCVHHGIGPSRRAQKSFKPRSQTSTKGTEGESAYIVGRLGNVGEGGDRHFG